MKYGHTITMEFTSKKEEPTVEELNLALKQFLQVTFPAAENITMEFTSKKEEPTKKEEDDGDVDEF